MEKTWGTLTADERENVIDHIRYVAGNAILDQDDAVAKAIAAFDEDPDDTWPPCLVDAIGDDLGELRAWLRDLGVKPG